jgi:hypothetical protein
MAQPEQAGENHTACETQGRPALARNNDGIKDIAKREPDHKGSDAELQDTDDHLL